MVAGQWTNLDGLPLNFGVTKALPEMAGDYLIYGDTRALETYITYGQTIWNGGTNATPVIPAMASGTFTGTGTPATAGIVSQTLMFPLQTSTASGAGNTTGFVTTSGVLNIATTQIWVEEMSFEVLANFNVGTGTSTGFSIGLVTWSPQSSAWQIVTPNASGSGYPNHFLQVSTFANLIAGRKWTWGPDGVYAYGSGSSTAPTIVATTWFGNIPLVTNSITPLPTQAYISAVATGAPATAGSAAGLAKLSLKYKIYGNIIQ